MTINEVRRRIGAAMVLIAQNQNEKAMAELEPFDLRFENGEPMAYWPADGSARFPSVEEDFDEP